MVELSKLGADDDHVGAVTAVDRHGAEVEARTVVQASLAGAAAPALGVVVGHGWLR